MARALYSRNLSRPMAPSYDFDLIVIGGGAAGEKGAVQAAFFGKKVALVEKEPNLGGAMVNTGTLPSKTLRETALYLSGFRQRGLHGASMELGRKANVNDFLFRLNRVVDAERARMVKNLEKHGVQVFHGTAKFVDSHSVSVGAGKVITGAHVLIATGSRPHRPDSFPFEHPNVYDSDEIVRVNEMPSSMVVVGGGVIGCEYACLFAALGTKVTVIDSKPSILGFLDTEVVGWLTERMKALGVEFRFETQVGKCEVSSGVKMVLSTGERLETDVALICAGRSANTDQLEVEKAGVTPGKRGQLDVDPRTFRTSVPHISAVGDVIGFPALASTSMEQARVAVVDMFDLKYKTRVAPLFPYGIYTIPEVSMCGETEESLRAAKVTYARGVASFSDNARGQMIGESGQLKLLFRVDDRRLVGVHCIGEGATELVHIGLSAMISGATTDHFIDACFNYPTLSEAYKYATYDALGKIESVHGQKSRATTEGWDQDLFKRTLDFAAKAHGPQTVPGSGAPYVVHLVKVASELLRAHVSTPFDINFAMQCALLHDSMEDAGVKHEAIAAEFSARVADGVQALTKNDALPKAEQMGDSLKRIKAQPREVWMVKLADRITNLEPAPPHWTAEKRTKYRAEAQEIHDALFEAHTGLAARIREKISQYAT
ncbi:MAG: Si-specific NAD(P)(+) transhydrogenase [Archangium sp.]